MTRRTARIVVGTVVIAVILGAWLARGLPGPLERHRNEMIAALLGLFAVLMVAWPLSLAVGPFRRGRAWRRAALICLPLAGLSAVACWVWLRESTAEPTRTLVYAAVIAAALAVMALLEWWAKRPL